MGLVICEAKCRTGEVLTRTVVSDATPEEIALAQKMVGDDQKDLNLFCMKACLGICWLAKWKREKVNAVERSFSVLQLADYFKGQMQN